MSEDDFYAMIDAAVDAAVAALPEDVLTAKALASDESRAGFMVALGDFLDTELRPYAMVSP